MATHFINSSIYKKMNTTHTTEYVLGLLTSDVVLDDVLCEVNVFGRETHLKIQIQ